MERSSPIGIGIEQFQNAHVWLGFMQSDISRCQVICCFAGGQSYFRCCATALPELEMLSVEIPIDSI
jgi:hypothetical protein